MKRTAPGMTPPWLQRLLRVPLFMKLVLANAVLVGALGAAALLLAPALPGDGYAWVAAAWAGGVLVVISANGLLAHLALLPLRKIEGAARRVEDGDAAARVVHSPLEDRELHRVTEILNRMLDSLEAGRRRQLTLSARILEAEEGERKRIANELFDDTAQLVSASLLHVELAGRAVGKAAASGHPALGHAAEALRAARTEMGDTLRGVQRIARGLRPPELDELGAVAALETHARRLTHETGPPVEIDGDAIDPWLDAGAGLALYRILQEGLVNAVIHGRPSRVHVRLHLGEERVRAVMTDDGRGFDAHAVGTHPERHVGILRMHERARSAGGVLEIDSRPGAGTRLSVSFPRVAMAGTAADQRLGNGKAPSVPSRIPLGETV